MLRLEVRQDGNRLEVRGDHDYDVFYEVTGIDLPEIADFSFTVWHALPHAMKNGFDIHVCGALDPATVENAEQTSAIWEMWRPQKFRRVTITADAVRTPPPPSRTERLTLFSGGVDSTHMLMKRGVNETPAPLLTVQGMDYGVDAHDAFRELIAQTDPVAEKFNYRRIFLRTNASRLTRGSHAWGMALGGHAHVFSMMFSGARFAADRTPAQDFLIFPFGCNHVTNPLLSGSHYPVVTECLDYTRAMKIAEIFDDAVALQAITFCKDRSVRPLNCGKCQKCLRTKLMFFATRGRIPDIFIDSSFGGHDVHRVDLSDPIERSLFVDCYQVASRTGTIALRPEIAERFEAEVRRSPRVAGGGWLKVGRLAGRSPAALAGKIARRLLSVSPTTAR